MTNHIDLDYAKRFLKWIIINFGSGLTTWIYLTCIDIHFKSFFFVFLFELQLPSNSRSRAPGLTTWISPEYTFLALAFILFLIEVNLRQESRVIPKRWKNVDPVLAQNFLPWVISFKWIAFILRQDSYVIPIRAKNSVGVVVVGVVVIMVGGVVIMMAMVAGVVVIVFLVSVTVRKWRANH